MSWNHVFLSNPFGGGPYGENPKKICFDVRSGSGTVRSDGTFTDVVETACRVPNKHPGGESVEYKGRRYALRGGIRTNYFITLTLPVGGKER